jgi:hypothetical protein
MIIILVQIVRTTSDDFEAKIWQRNFLALLQLCAGSECSSNQPKMPKTHVRKIHNFFLNIFTLFGS